MFMPLVHHQHIQCRLCSCRLYAINIASVVYVHAACTPSTYPVSSMFMPLVRHQHSQCRLCSCRSYTINIAQCRHMSSMFMPLVTMPLVHHQHIQCRLCSSTYRSVVYVHAARTPSTYPVSSVVYVHAARTPST